MLATHCYESVPVNSASTSTRIMRWYYAATAAFLLLDLLLNVNVRIAFLDASPALRAAYYGVCFTCLGMMLWRPAWTVVISAFESLVTLSALIISFGTRAILVSDAMLEGHEPFVSMPEIVNFLMSGSIAYIAWSRGITELQKSSRMTDQDGS